MQMQSGEYSMQILLCNQHKYTQPCSSAIDANSISSRLNTNLSALQSLQMPAVVQSMQLQSIARD